MYVFWNLFFEKSFFKLSCVYLLLGKLVNGNTFQSTEILSDQRKTFSSKKKNWFGFQENVFPFGCVCFPESGFRKTTFQTFMCLFAIRKFGQRKTLYSQRKI
jgi:hypothetical protein